MNDNMRKDTKKSEVEALIKLNETTPPAPANGQQLTMPQAIMLRTACEDGYIPTSYSDSQSDDKYKAILSLVELGLLKQSLDHFVVPTAKGRAVLANSQAAGEKPTSVKPAEFIADGYSEMQKRGECIVTYASDKVVRINYNHNGSSNDVYTLHFEDQSTFDVSAFMTLKVLWLPATAQPVPVGGEVTPHGESSSDAKDELTSKILTLLGVDPSDWGRSLSGIYAAIRSNLTIGEPQMSKVEDWTDQDEPNADSITANMFKLLKRAQDAEAQLAALTRQQQAAAVLVEALRILAKPIPQRTIDHWHKYGTDTQSQVENLILIARRALEAYEAAATGQPADGEGNG